MSGSSTTDDQSSETGSTNEHLFQGRQSLQGIHHNLQLQFELLPNDDPLRLLELIEGHLRNGILLLSVRLHRNPSRLFQRWEMLHQPES